MSSHAKPKRARPGRIASQGRLLWLMVLVLLFVGAVYYYLVGPRPFPLDPTTELSGARESAAYQPLSGMDRERLSRQRQLVRELVRRHVGGELTGDSASDLPVIQALLDQGVLAPDQTFELQALGVCLGDVLAASFDLEWIVYEDAVGRSRALRLGDSEVVLFPVTMISKRVEAGLPVDVQELWLEAQRALTETRPRA